MKRKIHINRKEPSEQEIRAHMDFNELLKKHEAITKRPRYNAIKVITGILIVFIIGALVFDAIRFEKNAIVPPLGKEWNQIQSFEFDASKEQRLELSSGTVIEIPANVIVTEENDSPTGTVRIDVQEFRTPVDFFLSGIPMTYDSAGTSYTFESGGMLRMEAYGTSGVLSLKEGASINVRMLTSQTEGFGVYRFDTLDNRWVREGSDQIEMEEPQEEQASVIYSEDGVTYQFSGIVPDSMTIMEAMDSGFITQDTLPIEGSDIAIKSVSKEEMDAWQRESDSLMVAYFRQQEIHEQVCRVFTVKSFGIWNCDNPMLREFPDEVELSFVIEGNAVEITSDIYVVYADRNALYQHPYNKEFLPCDLRTPTYCWVITGDGQLAIVSPSEFKSAVREKRPMRAAVYSQERGLRLLQSWCWKI